MGEGGRSKHAKAQATFIYVWYGRLALRAGTELQHPGVGDSLHFDPQTPIDTHTREASRAARW
jgi:hypothetical protein